MKEELFQLSFKKFKNGEVLESNDLNQMNDMILKSMSIMFLSKRNNNGILSGFLIEVESNQMKIFPGLAINQNNEFIILPDTKKIEIPKKIAISSPVVFGIRSVRKTTEQNQIISIIFETISEKELNKSTEHIELARVRYNSDEQFVVTNPEDPLQPGLNELDTRACIWQGMNDFTLNFIRTDLQHLLADEIDKTIEPLKSKTYTFEQQGVLLTTPTLCRNGLLSRKQFIIFLTIVYPHNIVYNEPNIVLIDFLHQMNKYPKNYIILSENNPSGIINLTSGNLNSIIIAYNNFEISFTVRRDQDRRILYSFKESDNYISVLINDKTKCYHFEYLEDKKDTIDSISFINDKTIISKCLIDKHNDDEYKKIVLAIKTT